MRRCRLVQTDGVPCPACEGQTIVRARSSSSECLFAAGGRCVISALIAARSSPIESLGKIAAVYPRGNTAVAEGGRKQNQRLQRSTENGSRQPEGTECGAPRSRDAGKPACEKTQMSVNYPLLNSGRIGTTNTSTTRRLAGNQQPIKGRTRFECRLRGTLLRRNIFVAAGFVAILIAENWPSRRAFEILLHSGRGRLSGRNGFSQGGGDRSRVSQGRGRSTCDHACNGHFRGH